MSSIAHTHQMHEHFDHTLAGLKHLIVQAHAKVARFIHEIRDVDRQIAGIVREFHKLADIHEVWYQQVPGYESSTFRIESQMDTAHHYLWGTVGGMAIAIVLGVYFSVTTLITESFWVLFFGSGIVAIALGILASIILKGLLGASSVHPHAAKKVNITIGIVGTAFFCLLAFFAWMRFQGHTGVAGLLPIVMVGLEMTAIVFAGACDVGYRMYRWSGMLAERHRHHLNHKAAMEDRLANEHVTLQELEYRLHQHENKPIVMDEVNHEHQHVSEHHAEQHHHAMQS
jgi:hypothetical protein